VTSCENASLETPLLFDPGERWEYGIGIDWVGKIVEAVSGKKLSAVMRENIFDPLGMLDTGFKVTPDMRARLAKVHQRVDNGGFEPLEFEVPQEPEFETGGGGLYSTAGDYLEFVRMILNRGFAKRCRLLEPETVAMMSTNQMGDCRVSELKSSLPALSRDAEFFPGMPKTWGLSFMINTRQAPTGRSAGSLAWAGLANSYYWIDPAQGVGGVYLTQIFPFADPKSLRLFYEFESAVYDSLR
jgi:CubicO group peptidase (beta-lactamase class C family)